MKNKKIKIAISGVGNRALPKTLANSNWQGWAEQVRRSGQFELVAAHDISTESLKRLTDRQYLGVSETFVHLEEMLDKTKPEALIITNPAEYHLETIQKALKAGCHVLVEKPMVSGLKQALALLNSIKGSSNQVCVVQNWRTKPAALLARQAIADGRLGQIGHIFFRYVRDRENPKYPPYIFDEAYPLLYAMGIHHLDLFQYLLDDQFESVQAASFKPSWSLYRSDTGLNLFLKSRKGVVAVYTGTISSKNKGLAQESLLIEGEKGSLMNESEWLEPPLWFYSHQKDNRQDLTKDVPDKTIKSQYDLSDEYILNNFYQVITKGAKPVCSASEAVHTMAVLEACRISCETHKSVSVDELFKNQGLQSYAAR